MLHVSYNVIFQFVNIIEYFTFIYNIKYISLLISQNIFNDIFISDIVQIFQYHFITILLKYVKSLTRNTNL